MGLGSRKLDIAIAGCGIAGLAAAHLLAEHGHRITLFDQFDEPRPLGSGLMLQTTGLTVLRRMGLEAAILDLGAPIDRLFGKAHPSGRTVLDVRYAALGGDRSGLGIHRAALFHVLFEAAHQVAAIETGAEIVETSIAADSRRALVLADGRRAGPFDLVIDAMGVRSPLLGHTSPGLPYGALWASLDWNSLDWPEGGMFDNRALEQRYERASKMVGVLPIGRVPGDTSVDAGGKVAFFWSLRQDAYAGWLATPLEAWKAEVLHLWPETAPLLDQIACHDDLVMARYDHHTRVNPIAPGLVHIGDSYHAASPQLGQGANMALLDALALATAIGKTLGEATDLDTALRRYRALRTRHVRLYQWATWLFTPVYQSDSRVLPFVRDWIMGPVSRMPPAPRILASLVAGTIGWPFKGLDLGDK